MPPAESHSQGPTNKEENVKQGRRRMASHNNKTIQQNVISKSHL
jgi:hypothetical protein